MKKKHQRIKQPIQIIAGEFRGRRITFYNVEGLRPTGVRIRETLFNWLQPIIEGSTCLDLFAGSGILGIEAISRHAKHVTFVEKNRLASRQLQDTLNQLKITNAKVIHGDYSQAINRQQMNQQQHSEGQHYDIIFLDPPYAKRLLPVLLGQIKALSPTYLFIEDNQSFESWITDIDNYRLIKSKKTGNIHYGLLQLIHDTV